MGDFIAPDGSVCGKHNGIIHYTIGQRKGLGIALGRPVFVSEIDSEQNKIYLSEQGSDIKSETIIEKLNVISGEKLIEEFHAEVKVRSTAIPTKARIIPIDETSAQVIFDTPQRAIAKGQSLVIYNGDEVIAGGFIAK